MEWLIPLNEVRGDGLGTYTMILVGAHHKILAAKFNRWYGGLGRLPSPLGLPY
jgi:hypothetical protein